MKNLMSMFRRPSPLQVASQMLNDAELRRLEASHQVDYFVAIERMYRERIVRLRAEILEMADRDDRHGGSR